MNLTEWKAKAAEFFINIKARILDCWINMLSFFKGLWARIPRTGSQSTGAAKILGKLSSRVKGTRHRGPAGNSAGDTRFFSGRFNPFMDWFRRNFGPGSVAEGKRRVMIFGIGGFAALFLVLIIAVLALNLGSSKGKSVQNLAAGPSIPVEDLFIPAEPDFVPQFLPEREPRRYWSLDDIRPYWKNPGNPDLWREEIKSAVDKIMEGVP